MFVGISSEKYTTVELSYIYLPTQVNPASGQINVAQLWCFIITQFTYWTFMETFYTAEIVIIRYPQTVSLQPSQTCC